MARPKPSDDEAAPPAKKGRSLRDYADALRPRPLDESPQWLVRTRRGFQFSTHFDEAKAQATAKQIGGTVEPYSPIVSTYWDKIGPRYDH